MKTRILIPAANLADYNLIKPKLWALEQAGYVCVVEMGCYIDDNRNFLVTDRNQKIKQQIPDGLSIFIDCDMDFDVEDVRALEDAAHSHPVIGAPYNTQKDNGVDCCGNKLHSKTGIIEVPRIGTGFLAINNFVFNHLEYPFFTRPVIKKDGLAFVMGEDLSFCERIKKAGFKIYAHYGININHQIRKDQLMQPRENPPQPGPDLDKAVLAIQEILATMNKMYRLVYAQGAKDQEKLNKILNEKPKMEKPPEPDKKAA